MGSILKASNRLRFSFRHPFLFIAVKSNTMTSADLHNKQVAKSFMRDDDKVMEYCMANTHVHPVQKALQEETLRRKVKNMKFLGALEVLAMNKSIIRMKSAKKVLDVGMFTGASALAAGLAMLWDKDSTNHKIVTMDLYDTHIELARSHWKMAGVEDKIVFEHGKAGDTLQKLIDNGESETYDFAFMDGDKATLDDYYEKCLKLLKPGGAIGIDNSLLLGFVLEPADRKTMHEEKYTAIVNTQNLNAKIAKDTRVHAVQFNIGDGYTLVTKL